MKHLPVISNARVGQPTTTISVEFIDTTTFLSDSRDRLKVRAALDGGKIEEIHPKLPCLSIFDMGNNMKQPSRIS